MKYDPDDPRFTALAAGEPDPELAAWLESAGAPDGEEARREAAELRSLFSEVRAALAADADEAGGNAPAGLGESRKADLLRQAAANGAAAGSAAGNAADAPPASSSSTHNADAERFTRRVLEIPVMKSSFFKNRWLAGAVALLAVVLIPLAYARLHSIPAGAEKPARKELREPPSPPSPSSPSPSEAKPSPGGAGAARPQAGESRFAITDGESDVVAADAVDQGAGTIPAGMYEGTAAAPWPTLAPPAPDVGYHVGGVADQSVVAATPLLAAPAAPLAPAAVVTAAGLREANSIIRGLTPAATPAVPPEGVYGGGLIFHDGDGVAAAAEMRGRRTPNAAPGMVGGAVFHAGGTVATPTPSFAGRPAAGVRGFEQRAVAGRAFLGKSMTFGDVTLGDSVAIREDAKAAAVDPATGYAIAPPPPAPGNPGNMDRFDPFAENRFIEAAATPYSTFAGETDTASYALVRAFLERGQKPPRAAVRLEELINYFPYDYAPPSAPDAAFAAHAMVAPCPWQPRNLLLRIGVKGKVFSREARPACNLTFLVDVSGSMHGETRLELVKYGLRELVKQLDARDRVSIVTYANGTDLLADGIAGDRHRNLAGIIDGLAASGGTNGQGGIQLAYATAKKNVQSGAVNRVILCTDGDFNVGLTDRTELGDYIKDAAKSGVFLSVLGFGMGNHRDDMLSTLARAGQGNHAYIGDQREARKALVDEMLGTLVTIAKDLKFQVIFNPAAVRSYRLLGYENRLMAREDFADDAKDGGEVGAGHSVTALYELAPETGGAGEGAAAAAADTPFQKTELTEAARRGDYALLAIRDKTPEGEKSRLREFPVTKENFTRAPDADFRFAAAVAAWGMLLRDSEHKGEATYGAVREWAAGALGPDREGYRKDFLELLKRAE